MRADPPRFRPVCIQGCPVSPDDLIDPEPGQRTGPRSAEDWVAWRCASLGQKLSEMLHRLIPEWTHTPLVALAVQMDFRWRLEVEMLDAKIGDFLDPSAGVVQEEQQRAVAQR